MKFMNLRDAIQAGEWEGIHRALVEGFSETNFQLVDRFGDDAHTANFCLSLLCNLPDAGADGPMQYLPFFEYLTDDLTNNWMGRIDLEELTHGRVLITCRDTPDRAFGREYRYILCKK